MYRISFNCNDADLGPVVADLHRSGKISGVTWKFSPGTIAPPETPGSAPQKPQPPAPSRTAPKPSSNGGRPVRGDSLQNLMRNDVLGILQKYSFRRVERREVARELNITSEADKQRLTHSFAVLIDEGLVMRVDHGTYELSPDELARFWIAHLPGENGAQPSEQQ